MSEISAVWFDRAKSLEVDQAIFIRVANKKEQTALANELEDERDTFAEIDPTTASQFFINKVLKDRKQYVVIERKYRAIFTGFLRTADGSFSKISIDPERKRIITLMKKDGYKREDIEQNLNGLTEDEIAEFFMDEMQLLKSGASK